MTEIILREAISKPGRSLHAEVRERAKRQLAEGEAQARRERGGDRRKPPQPQLCPL